MRKWFALVLMLLSVVTLLELALSQQSPAQLDCRYRSVCMNYSQCLENGTKMRFCYDVNRCSPDYVLTETVECDYKFESHCQNSQVDYDETDIDCGGAFCNACDEGNSCKIDSDCKTGACDPLKGTCVPKDQKTSKLKAFATKRPFDFWLIILGLYAIFFAVPFIITIRLNDKKQKEFIVTIEQKKLQNSIDIFYLMLEKKDIYKAKLAYQLATSIAEKINEYLSEKDILDLEELRQDYQKYIVQFEPKKQAQNEKDINNLKGVDGDSKNLTSEGKRRDTNSGEEGGSSAKKEGAKKLGNEKNTSINPSKNPEKIEEKPKENEPASTGQSEETENKKAKENNPNQNKKPLKPPARERNDVFFVDESEFFDEQEPNF